mmetsp:Transcript_38057/g.71341  ORF Transcript_38057/g.71341 Transcript_38057/m.71341 type:complete len:336 (-) Transcript_38057:826-1833(-)
MDKYRKVVKPKEAVEKSEEEIRLTATGSITAYVGRAAKVYNELDKPKVVVTATGNALTKAVTTAEVIKRRFKGLHQITKLGNQEIVDEYEPIEEGLDKVTDTRSIPFIEITLSKEPLDTSDVGYQPPIDESLVTDFDPEQLTKPRGRGGGRGKGRGKGKGRGEGKGKGKGKGKAKGNGQSNVLGAPPGLADVNCLRSQNEKMLNLNGFDVNWASLYHGGDVDAAVQPRVNKRKYTKKELSQRKDKKWRSNHYGGNANDNGGNFLAQNTKNGFAPSQKGAKGKSKGKKGKSKGRGKGKDATKGGKGQFYGNHSYGPRKGKGKGKSFLKGKGKGNSK